ncbi:MAG: penicillin acylase family protein [Thermoanaerobaculia bacterium]|nr:penicillin acylase family protein [Thermoanaerobaculia bacterium]
MRGWDGTMSERGPAALYALVERNLLAEIFGDEMRRENLAEVTNRGLLLRALRGQVSAEWFDDVSTPAHENRAEIVGRALAAAWRETRERWGQRPEGWKWGAMHPFHLRHRLDAMPIYGAWARRGPFPMPGSATTVLAFGGHWEGGDYEITYGPSMRWIVDWSHPEAALAVLPGGQSGHPADLHYDDQIALYLEGGYHEAPWSEEAIARAAVSTLRLVP